MPPPRQNYHQSSRGWEVTSFLPKLLQKLPLPGNSSASETMVAAELLQRSAFLLPAQAQHSLFFSRPRPPHPSEPNQKPKHHAQTATQLGPLVQSCQVILFLSVIPRVSSRPCSYISKGSHEYGSKDLDTGHSCHHAGATG